MTERYIPAALRRLVMERAAGYCEYCRCPAKYAAQSFAIEHIVPRQAGGPTVADNLALACQGCNAHKAIKTMADDPATHMPAQLYHPRQHRWRDHFTWSDDFTEIIGLNLLVVRPSSLSSSIGQDSSISGVSCLPSRSIHPSSSRRYGGRLCVISV